MTPKSIFFSSCYSFLLSALLMGQLKALDFKTETEMLRYIGQYLPINPVIIEAGGHYGEHTLVMKHLWPKATIYVFEPLHSSYQKIVDAIKYSTNIYAYNTALSNYTGLTTFFINPANDGASSIGAPVAFNAAEFEKTPITVACTTINTWAKKNNVTKIDFMWLDMEGHELTALSQAENVLDTVQIIYTEADFEPVRENSCLYKDLKSFLETRGFQEIWKRQWSQYQGDALFIKTTTLNNPI